MLKRFLFCVMAFCVIIAPKIAIGQNSTDLPTGEFSGPLSEDQLSGKGTINFSFDPTIGGNSKWSASFPDSQQSNTGSLMGLHVGKGGFIYFIMNQGGSTSVTSCSYIAVAKWTEAENEVKGEYSPRDPSCSLKLGTFDVYLNQPGLLIPTPQKTEEHVRAFAGAVTDSGPYGGKTHKGTMYIRLDPASGAGTWSLRFGPGRSSFESGPITELIREKGGYDIFFNMDHPGGSGCAYQVSAKLTEHELEGHYENVECDHASTSFELHESVGTPPSSDDGMARPKFVVDPAPGSRCESESQPSEDRLSRCRAAVTYYKSMLASHPQHHCLAENEILTSDFPQRWYTLSMYLAESYAHEAEELAFLHQSSDDAAQKAIAAYKETVHQNCDAGEVQEALSSLSPQNAVLHPQQPPALAQGVPIPNAAIDSCGSAANDPESSPIESFHACPEVARYLIGVKKLDPIISFQETVTEMDFPQFAAFTTIMYAAALYDVKHGNIFEAHQFMDKSDKTSNVLLIMMKGDDSGDLRGGENRLRAYAASMALRKRVIALLDAR